MPFESKGNYQGMPFLIKKIVAKKHVMNETNQNISILTAGGSSDSDEGNSHYGNSFFLLPITCLSWYHGQLSSGYQQSNVAWYE